MASTSPVLNDRLTAHDRDTGEPNVFVEWALRYVFLSNNVEEGVGKELTGVP
jgi:hypothetical protein